MTEETRVCEYLMTVLADLDGRGLTITDYKLIEDRVKNYWLHEGEVAYVIAVPEEMMGY